MEEVNTELQTKLTSILTWVEETAKTAEAFAIEQTPLYIQELLAWNFWYSLIWFGVAVFWLIVGTLSGLKLIKNKTTICDAPDFPFEVLWVFPMIAGFLFGAVGFCSNLDWLQITVAPRVWLVEYVASKL